MQEAAGHDVFFNAVNTDTGVKYLKSLGTTTSYNAAGFASATANSGG
jgi:hypothetical protein